MDKREYFKNYYEKNKEKFKKNLREYYEKNKDKIKIYNESIKEKRKKYMKEWRLKNKEKRYRYNKIKYQKTKSYNKYQREYRRIYTKKNPLISKAHQLARYNIQIINQRCESCNENIAVHRHHPNYNNPLEVELLCINCHLKVHNKKPIII